MPGVPVADRQRLIDTIAEGIPPVHSEGYKFLAIGAIVTLALFLVWSPLGWLAALITLWMAFFFRDPPRVTPLREGLVVAPADGRISRILNAVPPAELGLGERAVARVSIFMSVFDCHVNRSPVTGRI